MHQILRFAVSFLLHSFTVMRLRISKLAKSLRHKKPKALFPAPDQYWFANWPPYTESKERTKEEADRQSVGGIDKRTYL